MKPTRRHTTGPTGLLGVLIVAALVPFGDHSVRADGDGSFDVSKIRDAMQVVSDGKGRYVAMFQSQQPRQRTFFYGDGKTFHLLRYRTGRYARNTGAFRHLFQDPRAEVAVSRDRTGRHQVSCGKRTRDLKLLGAEDAKPLLAGARFDQPLFKREAYVLARDERLRYYYVDRLRGEFGGKSFRLFRGLKGVMKQLPLVDVIEDAAGTVFVTRSGKLRFVSKPPGGEAAWIRGKRRVALVNVPVDGNNTLIFVDLGVYEGERFGTPCDDL